MIEHACLKRDIMELCSDACEEIGLEFLVNDLERFTGMGNKGPEIKNADEALALATAVMQDYGHYKCMPGIFLWDEPSEENFETIRLLREAFEKVAPDKLLYTLVLPSYGRYAWDPNNVDDCAYKNYIDGYMKTCDPHVVCVDYYPLVSGTESLMENNLWRDLGYCRKHAMETGKPLWFYFQASAVYGGKSAPTDAGYKVQMYSALAYGTKGLSYFCAEGNISVPETGGPTERFEALKEINFNVRRLGDFLLNKDMGPLYHTGLREEMVSQYCINSVSEAACPFTAAPDGLLIGTFQDAEGQYLVIVNKDYNEPVEGTLQLKETACISCFLQEDGTLSDLGTGDSIALALPAGDCAVYRLSAQ